MHRAFCFGLAALLLGGTLAFAADTFESVVKDMSATMKEMIETLRSVKDGDTAKTALPKLRKTDDKAKDLAQRLIKLGKPADKQDESLLKKFFEESETFDQDLKKEAKRIKGIKDAEEISKFLEKKK